MVEGYQDTKRKRKATNTLITRYRKRKFDRRMLLIEMKPHERKIVKTQAVARGWLTRRRWVPQIKQVKWENTKKEIGLSKVKDGLDDAFDGDELDDLNDFFHDEQRVKGDIFDREFQVPEDKLPKEMKDMLSILNKKPKKNLPPLAKNPPIVRQISDDAANTHKRFPSGSNPNMTDRSNNSSKQLSEISRKMLQNNNEYMRGPPDTQFFHGPGMKREKSPTSVSGAITEIDLNSEKHQRESGSSFHNANQPIVNNLMDQSRGSFGGSQASKKPSFNEMKRNYVESWGVQSEESKKLIEARYLKLAKLKNKKKKSNASERIKMFRKQSQNK